LIGAALDDTQVRVVNFKGNGVKDATVRAAIGRVRAPIFGLDIGTWEIPALAPQTVST
jgi:hypothetical protein